MSNNSDIIEQNLLDDDNKILRYLKGEMVVDEERAFLSELQTNSELRSKTITMARLVKGLQEVGDAEDADIKSAMQSFSENEMRTIGKQIVHSEKKSVFSLKKASVWISIAASIALVIWSGVGFYNRQQTIGLANEYANAFNTSSMIVRGEQYDSEAESNLSRLFANIADGKDMDNTLQELSLYWEQSTTENYNDYTEYFAEIGWNLAIGYLKDNNRKDAKTVLKKLMATTDDGSIVHSKAQELLSRIEVIGF